jgi:hypothetical protein
MRFRIKAALSYGVNGPCSFLFNVAALQNRFQHVTEASLTLPVRPLAELPAEVLLYLFPSRYCQSDSLLRFARSEFRADHLTGFELVTRLCNWIYQKVG